MKFNEGFHKVVEVAKGVSNNTKKIAVGATILVGVAAGYNHENQKVKESENNKTEIKSEEAKINDILSRQNVNYVDAIILANKAKVDISFKLVGKLSEICKDIENQPRVFLENISKFKDIQGFDLSREVQKTVEKEPGCFLNHISEFKDIEGLNLSELITRSIEINPGEFLKNAFDPNLLKIKGLNLPKEISKAASSDAGAFLEMADKFQNIAGLNLFEEIQKAAKIRPDMFFVNLSKIKDIPKLNLSKEILEVAPRDPYGFLQVASLLKDIAGLNLGEEIQKAAKIVPSKFLDEALAFKDIKGLNLSEEILKAAKIGSSDFLSNASKFKDINGLNLSQEILKAAKISPYKFLDKVTEFKDIPGLNLSEEISKAAAKEPFKFLNDASEFKDIPGLNLSEEILKAANLEPSGFLRNASQFKDINGLNLSQEILKAAKKEPGEFLYNVRDFEDIKNLNLVEEILKAAKISPEDFLNCVIRFKSVYELNLSKEIVEAAREHPYAFLKNVSEFYNIEGLNLLEEIKKAAEQDPETFINVSHNLGPDVIEESEKFMLLDKSFEAVPTTFNFSRDLFKNKEISKLKSVNFLMKIKNPTTMALFHSMYKDHLSEDEALKIINNKNKFLKKLIEIKSTPNHLGRVSVDGYLRRICLEIVQSINYLHEANDETRFKSVESFDAKELYSLMVYGEEEIFTSSFNGLFNRLKLKLNKKTDGISGKDLMDQVGQNKFRIFIKECSGFNRLNEFLSTMNKTDADNLLIEVVKNIEVSGNKLSQAVTVASIFGNTEDTETLKILQKQVKIEYERISKNPNSKQEDKVIYGLLSGMFKDNAVSDKEWFKNIAEEYPIEKVAELKSNELFNKKNVCIQKYCFFESGDKDGVNSFDNFIKLYENGSKWKIDRSNEGFVIILGKNADKTVEIYANIPKVDFRGMAGLDKMDECIEKKKYDVNVYTYRGHSFGFEIDGDISSASLVNVGSCGGYNNLSKVLASSPHAHIISTQGTGSRYVNDPILWELNNLILSGNDIVWKDFWKNLPESVKNNDNFKDYVSPNKNQGAIFIKNFNAFKNKKT